MNNLVYVDPALLEGKLLKIAIFVKEIENWVIQSEVPKTKYLDEYKQISREKVLELYPELGELFDVEIKINHTISFVKTVNSGKWADFHHTRN